MLRRITLGPLPSWGTKNALALLDQIRLPENGFPCTFAVRAALKEGLRFGFIDELSDRRQWDKLRGILREYMSVYKDISRETSLIVFFDTENPDDTIFGYHRTFWEILQYLHDGDSVEWEDFPAGPDDPLWEFVFEGTPMFIVCSTPAHTQRRSRYSPVLYMTFQPRWVFEHIGPETRAGRSARTMIRQRLRKFDDGMEPSAALGNYGDPGNREWQQYFLADDNDSDPLTPRCPFRHRRQPPAVTE